MIPVEKIYEVVKAQAEQGSCKMCRWCVPFVEPQELKDGSVLTHECYIQGNVNSIWFTLENLNSRQYPWRCDEGHWQIDNDDIPYCLAFTPRNISIPVDDTTISEAACVHAEFMRTLAEAMRIYNDTQHNTLAKLTAKLNSDLSDSFKAKV